MYSAEGEITAFNLIFLSVFVCECVYTISSYHSSLLICMFSCGWCDF